jgi:hypothetical protein
LLAGIERPACNFFQIVFRGRGDLFRTLALLLFVSRSF